jgi:Clostripain family
MCMAFRIIRTFLTVLLLSLMLSSCGGSSTVTPSAPARWTFMLYLDADNDLDSYSQSDLRELMAVGSRAEVNIIVQYDGYGTPAVRYKVEKGALVKLVDLGEINMASSAALTDFIDFGVTKYPAEHYALVLWDHGDGYRDGLLGKRLSSILADWDNNGAKSVELSNYSVAQGITQAIKNTGVTLDILGIDACVMATIEAAYEFRNCAGILVSSQELVQLHGWDYRDLLTRLTDNPQMLPADLAKNMVASYQAFVEGTGAQDQTISALQLGRWMESLKTAVDDLGTSLSTRMNMPAARATTISLLSAARAAVQEFDQAADPHTYVDLFHLSQLIEGSDSPVQQALKNCLLAEYHGTQRSKANGLSIVFFDLGGIYADSVFLGRSLYDQNYLNLNQTRTAPDTFVDSTSWANMLKSFYTLHDPFIYARLLNWQTP